MGNGQYLQSWEIMFARKKGSSGPYLLNLMRPHWWPTVCLGIWFRRWWQTLELFVVVPLQTLIPLLCKFGPSPLEGLLSCGGPSIDPWLWIPHSRPPFCKYVGKSNQYLNLPTKRVTRHGYKYNRMINGPKINSINQEVIRGWFA